MTNKETFKWELHPRKEFMEWVRQEFPELKRYVIRKENYFDLGRRVDEVHEAAMLVLDLTMKNSVPEIKRYYSDDLKKLRASYEAKDLINYTGHLCAFIDAIDVE